MNATSSKAKWQTARLGELVTIKYGKMLSTKKLSETGFPVFGANGIIGSHTNYLYEDEQVLISCRGAYSGKINLSPPQCYITNNSLVLEFPSQPKITKRFLFYGLQAVDRSKMVTGSAQPQVTINNAEVLEIPVPTLDEQRQIVVEIEKQFTRLEAGVSALRRVQANLKRYRAAVLKAACEGKLVPTEAEWPKHQIASVIETMDQGWSPKCESEPSPDDETWAVIKTTAIQNLRFEDVENKKLPAILKPRPHLELQPGDLLVTRAGPRSRVGVACLVRRTRPRLMLCDKAYRLRCKSKVVNPAFLELILNAPHIVDAVNELKTGISDSGVNLTQKRFGELAIPLPPLAEQTRIVAEVERRLSVVEELDKMVSANLQRATCLRQSILQKAFAGELVKSEPVVNAVQDIPQLKPERFQRPNQHFARVVLSAEIVHCLHNETTFGRTKHQKIFHLCEYIAQIPEIEGQYHREAAGPLDNKLIYANVAELKKQKWYQETSRQSYGHEYQPMEKAGGHVKYLERYWPEKLTTIRKLIELMRTWSTDRCEIFSTAYAAWNDLILWGKEPTEEAILHEILDRWNETKRRFPAERWKAAIGWMKKNGYAPTGFGKPTKAPE